ncbi:hypothetical protein D9M70_636700 [compost metagenome]
MRSTLQHLVGEEPAFARIVAGHFELAPDVAADLGDRISLGIELAQGIEPGIEHPVDQRPVHRFLRAEIIKQIGLRHARHFGDLVDGRAAETIGGEDFKRRFQNALFFLFLDACPPLGPGRSR